MKRASNSLVNQKASPAATLVQFTGLARAHAYDIAAEKQQVDHDYVPRRQASAAAGVSTGPLAPTFDAHPFHWAAICASIG